MLLQGKPQFFEQPRQFFLLVLRKHRGEGSDIAGVADKHRVEQRLSFPGELCDDRSPVRRAVGSLHEPFALQVIDDTRDGSAANQELPGKLSQGERAEVSEALEDAELRLGQAERTDVLVGQLAEGGRRPSQFDPEAEGEAGPFSVSQGRIQGN